jgi:uncharacterized protein (TIGR03067 family)
MTGRLALLVTGFLLSGEAPTPDAVKQELKKLQGTWVIVDNTTEGKQTPELLRESKRYTIKGDHYSVSFKGAERPLLEFRLRVDPTKKPKTIDMIGLKTGQVLLTGLYELEGDTWKICLPVGNAARPKAIKSEPGSKSGIIVYKRVKGCSVKKGDRTPKGDIHNNRTERFAAADRPR